MNLSDLSMKECKELVNGMVDDRKCELLGDPDLGRPLDEKVRARLTQSLVSSERVTVDEIANNWASIGDMAWVVSCRRPAFGD